jgi:hypothetical protein
MILLCLFSYYQLSPENFHFFLVVSHSRWALIPAHLDVQLSSLWRILLSLPTLLNPARVYPT